MEPVDELPKESNSQTLYIRQGNFNSKIFSFFSTYKQFLSLFAVILLLGGVAAGTHLSQLNSDNRQHASSTSTFTVDLSQTIAPLHHNATGFVENVYNINTASPFVRDLHPNFIRTDDPSLFSEGIYNNLKAVFPRIQFVVGGGYQYEQKFCKNVCKFPGDNNDWTTWNNYVESYVNEAKAIGYAGEWDIWGEPDKNADVFGPAFIKTRSQEQFFQAWLKAYNIIRANFPQSGIDGPSLVGYGNGTLIKSFLLFAKSTHTLPNHVSWHDPGDYAKHLAQDVSAMRSWLNTNRLSQIGIDIQEYQGLADNGTFYAPGPLVSYIKSIEENAVLGAGHACWNPTANFSDCGAGNLDGAISSDGKPTPLWWVYDLYGQMDGNILSTQEISTSTQALSVYQPNTKTLKILIGQNVNSPISPSLYIKNILLPPDYTQATITGISIPNVSPGTNDPDPSLTSTTQNFSITIPFFEYALPFQLPQINSGGAYLVIVQFQQGKVTPSPACLNSHGEGCQSKFPKCNYISKTHLVRYDSFSDCSYGCRDLGASSSCGAIIPTPTPVTCQKIANDICAKTIGLCHTIGGVTNGLPGCSSGTICCHINSN